MRKVGTDAFSRATTVEVSSFEPITGAIVNPQACSLDCSSSPFGPIQPGMRVGWYDSEEYCPALEIRKRSASSRLLIFGDNYAVAPATCDLANVPLTTVLDVCGPF
jgi:hypothetical protein